MLFNWRQCPMGHSGDDVVHKMSHKMKTHWQNQLKSLLLVYFKVLYRIRNKKIDAMGWGTLETIDWKLLFWKGVC